MIEENPRGTSFTGFEPICGDGGLRFRYVMPPILRGLLSAELLCRGDLLDGTEGMPSRIFGRLGGELAGDFVVAPWQVHGTAVLEGRSIWGFPQRPKADGIHLDRSFDPEGRVRGSLRFADCAPILVASDFPRPWALMLHSGFRGTLLRVFTVAWERLRVFYKRLDPSRTFVWLGPAVGSCCYTRKLTDPLTLRAEEEWGECASRTEDGQARFDLLKVIEGQARGEGLLPEHIYSLRLCTSCNPGSFYSYRSGELANRMMLIVKLFKG